MNETSTSDGQNEHSSKMESSYNDYNGTLSKPGVSHSTPDTAFEKYGLLFVSGVALSVGIYAIFLVAKNGIAEYWGVLAPVIAWVGTYFILHLLYGFWGEYIAE